MSSASPLRRRSSKQWSSPIPMSLKSAARRVWLIWSTRNLILTIISGSIATISLDLNRINFSLRIQQRETSHSRTFFDWDSHSLTTRRICMNQASHSHWYPSVSILCQTKSEAIARALDPVACGWSTATSLRSGFRLFAYINVVGYDKCYLSPSPLALDLHSSEQQRAW